MADVTGPISLRAAAASPRAEILGEAIRIVHHLQDAQPDAGNVIEAMNVALGFDQACEAIVDALRTAQLSEPANEVDRNAAIDLIEHRLYRTHYLVVPRLAIQAMPDHWKARLEALLAEADAAGLETPAYTVLRKGDAYSRLVPEDENDPHGRLSHIDVLADDPWSDYRRGDVKALCPGFKEPL